MLQKDLIDLWNNFNYYINNFCTFLISFSSLFLISKDNNNPFQHRLHLAKSKARLFQQQQLKYFFWFVFVKSNNNIRNSKNNSNNEHLFLFQVIFLLKTYANWYVLGTSKYYCYRHNFWEHLFFSLFIWHVGTY